MICIGFAGIEVFDVVLYIGRTLTKLNYRVLIIDLSDSNALCKTIRHGMGLNSTVDIVNYRDINYTRKIPSKEELEIFAQGVVLIVYGFNYVTDGIFEYKSFTIAVNTFPHIMDRVNTMLKNSGLQDFDLLIRDAVTADDADKVKNNILYKKIKDVSYLYYDIPDYENAVNCQVTKVIRFTGITARMEKYIIKQVHDIVPQLSVRKIKKAIAAARRGV